MISTAETTAGATEPAPVIRVAVVDDHRIVLDGISSHLRFAHPDIRVVAAVANWSELLAHPEFPADVAVLDLAPGDDTPLAARVHTLASAGAHAVVMSSHSDAISMQTALRSGALAFVPKTDGTGELVGAIRAAAVGRRHRPESTPESELDFLCETTPGLGRQELRALILFATGRSVREVAELMLTTDETVKSYLKRGRAKFRRIGIDLGTRPLLRRHAVNAGWVSPE